MTLAPGLSWVGIARLGLVQMSLGAIAVFSLSTLNRIMVVELALPALVPGIFVGIHYAVQILRPRWGYGSDAGGRRTPWIVAGMALLAIGGAGAAAATALMASHQTAGLLAGVIAYIAIGLGAGAAGTSVLALLVKEAGPSRGPVAGPVVWIMMIFGFALSAGLSGRFLDPFSPLRVFEVGAAVSLIAFVIAVLAIWGLEHAPDESGGAEAPERQKAPFFEALETVWAEPRSRRLAIFIFVSMLAFSGQELLLEPFAGTVFKLTPGQSAELSSLLHAGAFLGMISGLAAAALFQRSGARLFAPLIAGGCVGSALGLLSMVYGSHYGSDWPVHASVAGLGFANGVYAVASIAIMMALASSTRRTATGTQMGVWGAAQGIASGIGGLIGTASTDAVRAISGSPFAAYLTVFTAEAALFLIAAWLAIGVARVPQLDKETHAPASASPVQAAGAAQ